MSSEPVRVDRWIWAVRLHTTRSQATDACRAGHVRVNGRTAKAATTVTVGDRVEVRAHGTDRVVEVARLLDKRMGAAIAAEAYVDHTPPLPAVDRTRVAARERGTGRPTKRERRELDRWRAR